MATKYLSGAAFFSRGFDTATTKEDLLSQDEPRQLAALEQVVAYMTIGRDMSGLFNEVAALTSSTNLTVKRLVYLYLQQNSRVQPEKAVLQAGTFVKDTLHDSTLYRGAALRTVSNLQISVMADFLSGPVRRCLADADPYVRRSAALALVKHYITAPSITFNFSLLEKLKDLLEDSNALVCGTAVAALLELHSRDAADDLQLAVAEAKDHLVQRLAEGNEWAAHYLLEGIAIAYYRTDEVRLTADRFVRDGEATMMKVLPYLSLQNIATATSAIKVVAAFLRRLNSYPGVTEEHRTAAERRFAPHLTGALLSQLEAPRHELRYVALRNTQVFTQSRRIAPFLAAHLEAFLIKHDDVIFVKLEKLDVLVSLADEANGSRVLSELAVHTRDSDPELASKSIRAIGSLATKLSGLAPQCMLQLEALIHTHVPRIVEDAAVVVQNVLRFYPGKFTNTIQILADALTVCNDVDAREAVVWVLGEYTDSVVNPLDYLEVFLADFMEQPRPVQFAVLTALAKVYTRGSVKGQEGVVLAALERVLGACTSSQIPDLRDRAFFYWRLLTVDPVTAGRVLAAAEQRVPPRLAASAADRRNQDAFLIGLGALESVLHQPIRSLLGDGAVGGICSYRELDAVSSEEDVDVDADTHARAVADGTGAAATSAEGVPSLRKTASGGPASPTSPSSPGSTSGSNTFEPVITAEEGGGVECALQWSQLGAKLVLNCQFQLEAGEDYVRHARVVNLQINRNMFSLGVQQVFPTTNLEPGEKPTTVGLVISCNNKRRPTRDVQIALELEPVGVRYLLAPPIPPTFLLLAATGCEKRDFLYWWKAFPTPTWQMPPQVADVRCEPHRLTANALRVHCINLVHRTALPRSQATGFLLFAETIGRERLLIELVVEKGVVVLLTTRCEWPPIAAYFGEYIQHCVASMAA